MGWKVNIGWMGKCLSSSSFSSGAFFLWDWKNNTITCTSREVSHDSNFRRKTTTTGTGIGRGSFSSNNNNSSRDPLHQAESKKYLGLRRKEIIRPKFSLVSPFHYYFFRWIFFSPSSSYLVFFDILISSANDLWWAMEHPMGTPYQFSTLFARTISVK